MTNFQLPPPADSKIFEYLLCDLFNETYDTLSFKCFGKQGHKQKGIDILSVEKDIIVQCKLKDLSRKGILLKKELLSDIENTIIAISKQISIVQFNQIYIATTFSEHPDFDEYCESIKIENKLTFDIIFWGWETIQRKLIDLPKTLAFHYTNFIVEKPTKEILILTKLTMKKKIQEDFSIWLDYSFENRRRNSKMIIHSIDDTKYPDHEKNKEGKYQWFGAEIKNLSHKGLEFTTAIEEIYVDKNMMWTDTPQLITNFIKVKVAKISILDFSDIVEYDLRGDEHHICPHFFCRFVHDGSPFIDHYYLTIDNNDVPYYFNESTRVKD